MGNLEVGDVDSWDNRGDDMVVIDDDSYLVAKSPKLDEQSY